MKFKIFFVSLFIIIFLVILSGKLFFTDKYYKSVAENLLAQADIKVNGDRPWDITVNNENFYKRVIGQGSLGLGESYMDGWWDCSRLDQFFFKILYSDLDKKIRSNPRMLFDLVSAKLFNFQSVSRAFQVGQEHYDLDNDLFKQMLDKNMIYSCGYWANANNLDDAQEHKLDLICKKLNLTPGMKVLDVGCGWGGFAAYAAKKYGVEVVCITVSKEQAKLAQEVCKDLPVTISIRDYRDLLDQKFDRVVSVGMFEHVGYKNYKTFMNIVHKYLRDDGLFLLHTIGGNKSTVSGDAWISKYIFPNGMLPSICQISDSFQGLFNMEDWHNFGTDYDKTLMEWSKRFDANWETLKSRYDARFYRMWKYYLLACAGMFRARGAQLWQIVLSKKEMTMRYNSIR